ncbi:DnaA ATPase domain-containing protein [Psychromarinibacter halotolerans]|uniref:DnaA ATPase domain-containing protein n=1 Tax=Psychromarinibacter halotolerans TaxID=1775175 RepID=A0ABV7GYG1_9RHOB|nr:DnaA/Hda family protein [Psychromarinibacter halotolerans]MDF0598004.1 DnaA/Hda family protein [Psychromarinibacter halotolerans]
MDEQYSFDLTRRPSLGRGDFFISPANATAVATVESWPDWPSAKLVLHGPEASGKTHLAHVWAAQTEATITDAADLSAADIPVLVTAPVVIEDADTLAGDDAAERALFHLHNLCLAEGRPLLLTAARPPLQWGLRLPDLASRMQATATAELQPPDDMLLTAVLVKQLIERQIDFAPDIVTYAIQRMERRFSAAADLAAALNRAAFSGRRKRLTKPLVRDVLDKLGQPGS